MLRDTALDKRNTVDNRRNGRSNAICGFRDRNSSTMQLRLQ